MVDFIEYVVSELKSKRLSKANALALIKQFSLGSPKGSGAKPIHPLLHSNTSDLNQQSYCSVFNGDEHFLADHQVAISGDSIAKVLPGVAYLEMGRAAVEQAAEQIPGSIIELRNIFWVRPVLVSDEQSVDIALMPGDDGDEIGFEVYGDYAGDELMYCQGAARYISRETPVKLDLAELKTQMQHGLLMPDAIYAAFQQAGLHYGPAHQALSCIYQGSGQVLAKLSLPAAVQDTANDYVLHPSLMDCALQASIGLLSDLQNIGDRPSVPFALDSLCVFGPCTAELFAWVRYAAGSSEGDKLTKLDIDLCDSEGNVCVQIRGFSSRVVSNESMASQSVSGSLLAGLTWEPAEDTAAQSLSYAQTHVLVIDQPEVVAEDLASQLGAEAKAIQSEPGSDVAASYSQIARQCFDYLKQILSNKPQGQVLVQIAASPGLYAGLSGLLKTAQLENPQLIGQLILSDNPEQLSEQLAYNQSRPSDSLIRYRNGQREVPQWEELNIDSGPVAFKDDGVYLITGGLGGLGRLFIDEIQRQTSQAQIIVTGRSTELAEDVEALGVIYRSLDVNDGSAVSSVLSELHAEYGGINGILHSAGMIQDNFILKKPAEEFAAVLEPKVMGTYHLDQASAEWDLDFMVLFSSLASASGNVGQSDYASGNGFMDCYAAYRNELVSSGERSGRTLSVNWPLWSAGGMQMDATGLEQLALATGMHPMSTETGMSALYASLASGYGQTLVMEGALGQLRETLSAKPTVVSEPVSTVSLDAGAVQEQAQDYIRQQLSSLLKMPSHKIDPQAPLENYGIDSILAMNLTNELEKTFGSLPKTLFFEYQTIAELTEYFVSSHGEQLSRLFAVPVAEQREPVKPVVVPKRVRRRRFRTAAAVKVQPSQEPIAIIGLSGRYPEAADLAVYWENLRTGKDCIVEVPESRWNWQEHYSEDRTQAGRHYSKWGGFIEGVDEFDPLFFNISPLEAESIDPQERLFLQHAWMAVEDAGYTRESLQLRSESGLSGQVGVYAGVMYGEYLVSGSLASIANRVSYVLNLHGPSMTLDTMCSSSLTAIHLACQDLRSGRTDLGLAGGVNVSVHPNKYLMLSEGQFISSDGHCQSFGEGGDGYIPGEGVGVVLLKRLSEAERDADHIYGLVKGSALNHGGKTNGFSVPNPQAQTHAIERALADAKVNPRHVSYVEAHGTGTKLGDPIEIAALSQVFGRETEAKGYCLIGSAKSNVGHCESAAGIAGLTKVLLQMKHGEIVPSLHSSTLNPNIDFERTPFVVNQELRSWERPVVDGVPQRRIAGISSFGAGGSNAHMVIEEYVGESAERVVRNELPDPVVVPLSARTEAQLRQKAEDLLEFIRTEGESLDLLSLAYTLQVGREAMGERLGVLVSSLDELSEKLLAFIHGDPNSADIYYGVVEDTQEGMTIISRDDDMKQAIDRWIARKKFGKLLDLWVKGLELDWRKFYAEKTPQRISLPAYPFAKERYWLDASTGGQSNVVQAAILHPLLHTNTSNLSEQSYASTFDGTEFFLADHRVKTKQATTQKVLPGAAYLEIARAAVEQALAQPEAGMLELQNVVWAAPLVVDGVSQTLGITLLPDEQSVLEYQIYSEQAGAEIVHCQGYASFNQQPAPEQIDLAELKVQMQRGVLEAAEIYATFNALGLEYGSAHRAITKLYRGQRQALAELRLPQALEHGHADFVLHPSLLDSALQASIGLVDDLSEPLLPYAVDATRIIFPCSSTMFAWVRYAAGSSEGDKLTKLDIDLCDSEGNVCVQIRGFSSRVVSNESMASQSVSGSLLAGLTWEPAEDTAAQSLSYAQTHVLVIDQPEVVTEDLASQLDAEAKAIQSEPGLDVAASYSQIAQQCFDYLKQILSNKPQGQVLVQIAAGQDLSAGLSGLLKTAQLENPQLIGQLILSDNPEQLSEQLAYNQSRPSDSLIRYRNGQREVPQWEELSIDSGPVAFKDDGVYLITGGLGGLGRLFIDEIQRQTSQAQIIVTGRSTELAEDVEALGVIYRSLDVNDGSAVSSVLSELHAEYGGINGILHSAGMIQDNFILKKPAEEFAAVLEPKVMGTYHLDQASAEWDLDFMVLFSSLASASGNVGQSDYASGNGFMDCYAAYRNELVSSGERSGRTLSVNWPLWLAGGMQMDATGLEQLALATGMHPMSTETGMSALYASLASGYGQTLVMEGALGQLRGLLHAAAPINQLPVDVSTSKERYTGVDGGSPANQQQEDLKGLREKTQEYLKKQLSALLKLPPHKIGAKVALEHYGIDSVLAMNLTNELEKAFGPLSKTLLFEYQTIADLAAYLVRTYPEIVLRETGTEADVDLPSLPKENLRKPAGRRLQRLRPEAGFATRQLPSKEVAVIGLSGRYPLAENLDQFWQNLAAGVDCITEIPTDRWDHSRYFDPNRNQPGKCYSKWGGFVADVDKFDPLFFNISPREAEVIDPQERLFLETAWLTIEDAGYSKQSLSGSRVGVYVGVMWGQYELFGAEALQMAKPVIPNSSYASIANRVSYFLNLHGPSIALDTMCSSSLTAIHLASEEIRRGEIDAAIAGGVNVSIHPLKYLNLSQSDFTASDGRCRSFGEGGDGYVPGEGVGAVFLKPLERALKDGDHIYALIKSSSLNHGGKTNGYTVPNPVAQGNLILETLHKADIDPATVGCIETHGTGTALGDPIEITGLCNAFAEFTEQKQFCSIGSVKSNIGHLESAAGIAAITKAILQIKHKQLVPSLHADPQNPNINFADSPFYVQTKLQDWEHTGDHPRRIAVSSFGAGGSNAHVIMEEYAYPDNAATESMSIAPQAFVLSARNRHDLINYAIAMAGFINTSAQVSFSDLVYTSQVGRSPMTERLVVVAHNLNELETKLQQWIDTQTGGAESAISQAAEFENVFDGNARNSHLDASELIDGDAGEAFLDIILARQDLTKIARLWVSGVDIDWSRLQHEPGVKRLSIPTYPFTRERYWVATPQPTLAVPQAETAAPQLLVSPSEKEQRQRLHYTRSWQHSSLADTATDRSVNGPTLVLDADDSLYSALGQVQSEFSQQPLIHVKPADAYAELGPQSYTVDLTDLAQCQRLLDQLKARDEFPVRIVSYHSVTTPAKQDATLAAQLDSSFYTLINLCQSLMRYKQHSAVRFLSVFTSNVDNPQYGHAALGGFFKTLALENPIYAGKVVELPSDSSGQLVSPGRLATVVLDEFAEPTWHTTDVRYEHVGGQMQRRVGRLVPAPDIATQSVGLPLKHAGVYIISGGLGGLGRIFSEYLAKNLQAKLVLLGRSPDSPVQQQKLDRLSALGGEAVYLQTDVTDLDAVQKLVDEVKQRFNAVNGVIHAAGVTRDSFILHKSNVEAQAVIESKVSGMLNLDQATKDEDLDVFVAFSSIAGVLGNPGQCDYAYANHFVDLFAEHREVLQQQGRRRGKTLAINWPYWAEGGMSLSQSDIELTERRTGMSALPTQDGIEYWQEFLRSDLVQGVALYGFGSQVADFVRGENTHSTDIETVDAGVLEPSELIQATEAYLKRLLAEEIRLAPERIDTQERFEAYGIDSVMINNFNANLENDLGELPKTLFYEYETIAELTQYMVSHQAARIMRFLNLQAVQAEVAALPVSETGPEVESVALSRHESEPMAIIGMHGRFPHSENLDAYWENLKQGRDLIDVVPAERWDCEAYYAADPSKVSSGKIYSKWGGFLSDYDKFDAELFNISDNEARAMDPQERIFLESVWASIEDAGYTRDSLKSCVPKAKSADVGVFVGVTTNSYHLLAPEKWSEPGAVVPGSMPWSIANRVSYFFDFQGPSIPIDTACSSSLVAIHMACQSIRRGECQAAVAGGVNLYLHPHKYQSLCQGRMLARGSKCFSFGAGDDGFVPGEGVGSVLLKPLTKAVADRDHIHAVISAGAFDHAGRSNGYSAPNPNSQANLIRETLTKYQVSPESISYIEGHGTGTVLGDSLEIASLSKAFQAGTDKKHYCPIGAVKANIGHSESAAGIAGVVKVLLQMKHRQLAPSIHSDPVNPNIDFADSPFYLQQQLTDWSAAEGFPRRALINSFGAGGVNACVVLDEYTPPDETPVVMHSGPYLFVLSARNQERLRSYTGHIVNYLDKQPEVDLERLCYTYQVGREAMPERLAMIVENSDQLVEGLRAWSQGESVEHIRTGSLDPHAGVRKIAAVNDRKAIDELFEVNDLAGLAEMWLSGKPVDWTQLYVAGKPARMPLPTYPFERQRHWLSDRPITQQVPSDNQGALQLHPLITYNSSTLAEVSFSSVLSDHAFYARDHKVDDNALFPGAGFLEMACVAGNLAGSGRVSKVKDIIWAHPLDFDGGQTVVHTLLKPIGNAAEFEVVSLAEDGERIVHSEGRVLYASNGRAEAGMDHPEPIHELRKRYPEASGAAQLYRLFANYGLDYGLSFRTIREYHTDGVSALAKLQIPDHLIGDFDEYILHPCIIDGALQAIIGLGDGNGDGTPYLPFALDEIEIIRSLPRVCYAFVETDSAEQQFQSDIKKFNISLLSESGDLLLRLKNFYVRALPGDEGKHFTGDHNSDALVS